MLTVLLPLVIRMVPYLLIPLHFPPPLTVGIPTISAPPVNHLVYTVAKFVVLPLMAICVWTKALLLPKIPPNQFGVTITALSVPLEILSRKSGLILIVLSLDLVLWLVISGDTPPKPSLLQLSTTVPPLPPPTPSIPSAPVFPISLFSLPQFKMISSPSIPKSILSKLQSPPFRPTPTIF